MVEYHPKWLKRANNREAASSVQSGEGQERRVGGGAGGERLVAGRRRNGTLLGATLVSAGGVVGLRFGHGGVWSACAGAGASYRSARSSASGSSQCTGFGPSADRKSTRLNSSHLGIS